MLKTFLPLLLILCLALPCLAETFETPRGTLDAYLKACREGDEKALRECYTKSSRELAKADAAEGQGEVDLAAVHEHLAQQTFTLEQVNKKRAIFWAEDESVPPFFLRVQDEAEGWRIDYHFMSRYMRVNPDGWSWRNKRIFELWKKRE